MTRPHSRTSISRGVPRECRRCWRERGSKRRGSKAVAITTRAAAEPQKKGADPSSTSPASPSIRRPCGACRGRRGAPRPAQQGVPDRSCVSCAKGGSGVRAAAPCRPGRHRRGRAGRFGKRSLRPSRPYAASGADALTLLDEEMRNEETEVRIDAMRRLDTVAAALGPDGTVNELVPFLIGEPGSPRCRPHHCARPGMPLPTGVAAPRSARGLVARLRGALTPGLDEGRHSIRSWPAFRAPIPALQSTWRTMTRFS